MLNNKLRIYLGIIILCSSFILVGTPVHASCGQNEDTFILYNNRDRVYDSNTLVYNTNALGDRKFISACLAGVCHTPQSSAGVYLVTVQDPTFIRGFNEIIDQVISSTTDWKKRFPYDFLY